MSAFIPWGQHTEKQRDEMDRSHVHTDGRTRTIRGNQMNNFRSTWTSHSGDTATVMSAMSHCGRTLRLHSKILTWNNCDNFAMLHIFCQNGVQNICSVTFRTKRLIQFEGRFPTVFFFFFFAIYSEWVFFFFQSPSSGVMHNWREYEILYSHFFIWRLNIVIQGHPSSSDAIGLK